MNRNFAIAVLVGVVHAQGNVKPTRTAKEAKFHNYMAQYNKSYQDPAEAAQRMRNFEEMELKIEEWNYNSARSGRRNHATFGVNQFSDLTEEEFIRDHTGFHEANPADRAVFRRNEGHNGRGLVAVATTRDWSNMASGKMTPVKN